MQRFFALLSRRCGNKTRQPEVSAVVRQLLVSNKSTHATGNISVVSNRYESPYAAAGPGFSPEAGAVCSLRCERRPASSADVLSEAYLDAARIEDAISD